MSRKQNPLQVVPSVDLGRYMGKWYEIAHLPVRFERDCTGDITAEYTLRKDGKVTVVNSCRKTGGHVKSVKGTARVANPTTGPNTKLKVTFFWPFSGDYWIIDLSPDYEWAVVGAPTRKNLWILSRRPHMDDALYERILGRATQRGYDVRPLVRTRQSAA